MIKMYGNYNPYMPQNRYQGIEQPMIQQTPQIMPNMMAQRNYLNGKVVESIDVARNIDIPCDGSTNYYVVADNSAIVSKQIQLDGTSKIIVYKPVTEDSKDIPKYVTAEDLDKAIKDIDLSEIDDIKEKLSDIKDEIKELKKKKKDD